MAEEYQVPLVEVSAKDGTNVELACLSIATPLVNEIRKRINDKI